MLNDKNDNMFLNALNDIDDDLVEEIAEAPVEPEIIPDVPKKSRFIRFIPAAASLAIVAAVGIGALIMGSKVLTPWGGGNTAGNESEPMSSETEQSDIQTDSTADTTPGQSASAEETDLSPSEISPEINTDIISELGMTYRQMTEKYGEARGGIFNTYEFGGYGRYTWKSYEGKFYDDMESAGGCNYIAGVKPKELFLGAAFPMDFEELANQYDLVPVSIGSEIGMDDCYWSEFTCSLYENVKFVFATLTYGSIDETVSCTVILDVDCLEAKPVVTASSSESSTGTNTDTENSIPEGALELMLTDGNKVTEQEIVKCDKLTDSYAYTVNAVFAYPCGTVNGDKEIGNNFSVSKLSEGSKWGDFTVTKAEAAYQVPSVIPSNVLCQYLWLKGNISFECKAYYSKAPFENNESIVIELPEEISKKLPSLSPYADYYGDDEVDDCLYFMTYPGDGDFGREIAEKLETEDEVEVTVSADEIKLQYTYFGLQTDGGTWGSLVNVIDYEIK